MTLYIIKEKIIIFITTGVSCNTVAANRLLESVIISNLILPFHLNYVQFLLV